MSISARWVTFRCARCAATGSAPALAVVDPDAGQVRYVTRQPTTISVGVDRKPAAAWGGRTATPPVRTSVGHFACRRCGAKPRVKRSTLLRRAGEPAVQTAGVAYL